MGGFGVYQALLGHVDFGFLEIFIERWLGAKDP